MEGKRSPCGRMMYAFGIMMFVMQNDVHRWRNDVALRQTAGRETLPLQIKLRLLRRGGVSPPDRVMAERWLRCKTIQGSLVQRGLPRSGWRIGVLGLKQSLRHFLAKMPPPFTQGRLCVVAFLQFLYRFIKREARILKNFKKISKSMQIV